jgi:integrase/recombinase XerD
VPVPGELIRLWSNCMHEEYGELGSDFVFVNLWGGEVGRPLSYASVNELVMRTRRELGFHFTMHRFRHTFATLAYRDGVAVEVIGAVLTHRSPTSTLVYTHLTAEDLRRVLAERGVLDRVADLLA